jgi:hypothetical protein
MINLSEFHLVTDQHACQLFLTHRTESLLVFGWLLLVKLEVTYVLQSKWELVTKCAVDDIKVLRWSKKFGTDTQDGREIKQGTIAIFAGVAFNQNTTIKLGEEEITLPQYTARMKIDLIKTADFNK